MICSMVKKGLLGAALGAGALYLVFGTATPSYVKTAFHKVRHGVKNSTPLPFEIDRAKQDIADLEPAILNNREELARAEVDVEHLEREIATVRANLAGEKSAMVTLRDKLASGDLRLTGRSNVSFTEDEIKAELAHRLDHYRNVNEILKEKESTLKARQKAVDGARKKLQEMANQKKKLATKLEWIQAKLQEIEATQEKNEFHFDDTALARAKQTVSELERRLEVKARVAEMEGRFSDSGLSLSIEPGRDPVQEFDKQFGSEKDAPAKIGDKSL